MRYSLLSRFQGTLLGATLGEILGSQCQGKSRTELPVGAKLDISAKSSQIAGGGAIIALATAQSLIKDGTLEVEEWRDAIAPFAKTSHVSTEAVIATLPIALFFHEDENKLRRNTNQTVEILSSTPELRDGVLAVGYAIAQSLKEKLDPQTLIPTTLAYLQESQTPLVGQLAEVQKLLEHKAGLEIAIDRLATDAPTDSTPLALAFYCFLSTLENFRLSVLRAARTAYQPQITTALTGALSGAYNSIAGIPVEWQMPDVLVNPSNDRRQTTADILQISSKLLAVWSGVYDLEKNPLETRGIVVVAAPRVIRPR